MRITVLLTIAFIVSFLSPAHSQKKRSQEWYQLLDNPNAIFYDIKDAFSKYEKQNAKMLREKFRKGKNAKQEEEETPGFEIYKRWEYFMEPRVYPSGNISLPRRTKLEFENYSRLQSPVFRIGGPVQGGNTISTVSNWSLVGPSSVPSSSGGSGRLNFVRIDPSNSSIIYVGSPAGGMWKTTNGGTSWSTTTDYLNVVGASDLVIDPTNTSLLFLATGDGDASDTHTTGVMKSTDGGATWSATGLSFQVNSSYVIRRLIMDPSDHNILYVASSTGIFKTVNAGVSWTSIISGNFKDIEFKPSDPATLYATSSTSFYITNNSGASWSIITSGLPATSAVNRLAIGVSPASASTVYVLASSTSSNFNGLYKSTDSGNTFTVQSTSPNILGYDTGTDTGGQGWYDLSIAINPMNADDVMTGGVNQWRSTDGGITWVQKSHWYGGFSKPYVHADVHALEYQPGSSTTLYSGNDGGIFKTTNNGTTWTDISSNLAIKQYYKMAWSPTTTTKVLGGSQDNGTDQYNGTSWTRVLGGDGMDCMYDFTNANIAYAEIYYGSISKTTNGSSFSNIVQSGGTGVNENGAWVTPMIMSPAASSTIYIGKSQVYKSINSGSAWTTVGSITGGSGSIIALALSAANANYIYAAKSNKLFVTTDQLTFTDRTTGLPTGSASITGVAASSTDANKVWVTFSGYSAANKVFYSADAGVTWTNVSGNLPNLPVNCIAYRAGSNSEVYIGADVGVYVIDANMSTWQPFYTNLPNVVVNDIEINNTLNKMRIGTYGRGIWESPIPVLNSLAADFYSDVTQACTNSTITFTNTSYGSVTTYAWDFGSGASPATSTSSGPVTVTYTTSGTKTIALTVTGPGGTNTITKTNYITTYAPPSAAGAITGASALCSNSLTGKTYSISAVAGATTYVWTVPTGSTITSGQGTTSINVSFSSIGGTVVVTAMNGSCASATQKLTVSINQTPQVSTGIDQSICAGTSSTLLLTSPSQTGSFPLRFTEISQFIGATGSPSSFPSFLEVSNTNDDYLEITNLGTGSVNAGGLIIQRWVGTTLNLSYTIPANTILPSEQPLVIHYGTGTDNPNNFYYRGGGSSDPQSSSAAVGYIIKSGTTVIDAVGVNSYSFPVASGVIASDWNGTIPSMSALAGVILVSPDVNNSTSWVVAASASPLTSFGFLNASLSSTISEPGTVAWTTVPSSGFSASSYSASTGNLSATTTFRGTLTNSYSTCSNSDTVIVNVSPSTTASVSIMASPSGAICQNVNVTFTATPANGGTPVYQWKKNGTVVGINNSTYSDNTLLNSDQISCEMTSSLSCALPNPAISNSITMTVNANITASVSITASPSNSICSGTNVSFTALAVNGGSPSYQWKKNGTNVGTNISSYSNNSLLNNDQIICVMTSTASCVSGSPATSNTITMSVATPSTASVNISANPAGAICAGTNVTFSATPTNGGTPIYQWKLNGTVVGTNSSTYSNNSLTNNNQIICVMTSGLACVTGSPATSNLITISVTMIVNASVSIAANPAGTICAGTNVTFTATPVNGGIPVYQWKKNSTNVGINSATYSDNSLLNNDQIMCVMTNSASCVTGNPASSNTITETVTPIPQINSFTPLQGPTGTTVSINGSGFTGVTSVKFNNSVAGFITYSSSLLTATVPAAATTGYITVTNSCGTATSGSPFLVVPVSITINLHLLIEGFYRGTGTMAGVISPSVCDTIILELHASTSPYGKIETVISTINTSGSGSFIFSNSLFNNSYYLVVKHRNSIETWSSNAVTLNNAIISYDFANAISKAYGNNQYDLQDGKFAIYNGDLDQNGIINMADLTNIGEYATYFTTGYHVNDITGDNMTELSDYSVIENNMAFGVSVMRP